MHDPEFRYYTLDRDLVSVTDGTLTAISRIPRTRQIHGDILDGAMTLLKGMPEEIQAWKNAMVWSWYNWLPGYFFEAPASATHKYHPFWANRPDGLLLHSLAVCRVAASLSDLVPGMTNREYDELVFAAWHHDMFKYGALEAYAEGEMTVHEHPVLAGDFFRLDAVRDILDGFGISNESCDNIATLIEAHAGPYRCSRFSTLKLPECAQTLQQLLFKSDYIASRKEDGWVQDKLAVMP